MSRARLVYFDCRGRVDGIRMAMELARFPYSFAPANLATWKTEDKEKYLAITPFGQLPVYEELDANGVVVFRMCQSASIMRHLARKFGLYGSNEQEMSKTDEILDTVTETHAELGAMTWNKNWEAERPALRAQAAGRFEKLEKYIQRVRASPTHLVTPSTFTVADIAMAYMLELSMALHPGLLEEYPNLHSFMSNLFTSPGPIRDYVHSERRPKTITIPIAPFGGKASETHQFI